MYGDHVERPPTAGFQLSLGFIFPCKILNSRRHMSSYEYLMERRTHLSRTEDARW